MPIQEISEKKKIFDKKPNNFLGSDKKETNLEKSSNNFNSADLNLEGCEINSPEYIFKSDEEAKKYLEENEKQNLKMKELEEKGEKIIKTIKILMIKKEEPKKNKEEENEEKKTGTNGPAKVYLLKNLKKEIKARLKHKYIQYYSYQLEKDSDFSSN